MAYRNPRDKTGICSVEGAKAEDVYSSLMEGLGFDVVQATIQQQFKGIDFSITSNFTVDVKAMKRLKRSGEKQDKYVWLEIKSNSGQPGWIYKAADFIAFERTKDFVMVRKKYLHEIIENLTDLETYVTDASECLYKVYSRKGRKDVLTLIQMQDILVFPHIKINKGTENDNSIN